MLFIQYLDPIGPHPEDHPQYKYGDGEFYCACRCRLCWDGEITVCADEMTGLDAEE